MAHLVRLIVLLLSLGSGIAHASFPATPDPSVCTTAPCYEYRHGVTANQPWGRSPSAACTAGFAAVQGASTTTVYTFTSFTAPTQCNGQRSINGAAPTYSAITLERRTAAVEPPAYTCPPNSTLSGSSCTCGTGFTESGSTCVAAGEAYCASITGSPIKTSWTSTAPSLDTRTVCSTGVPGFYSCNSTISPDFCGSSDGVTYLCHGSGVSAGTACSPSPAPEQPVPPTEPVSELPSPPPPGTCPGQVNGVTVNVPCSRTETKGTKTTTETDGAGNTTSKSESKSTSCNAAGSCSTTVTTTTTVNGGAPTTTTKTTQESKGEFCASNAGADECGDGDGSSFGGSCDAGFQCEGDAVQCALAKEVHTQNCKLNKVTDESTLYGAEKDLQGSQTEDLPGNETIPFGASSYDDSDAIGGAACVTDLSVEVFAQSLTLPLSGICPYLVWIRNALLALGSLAWLLIVFRR